MTTTKIATSTTAVLLISLAMSCTAADDAAVADDTGTDASALTVASASGITVGASRWVSARTFEVDISTPLVDPRAVNGPHRIRVTLPASYFTTTTTRYPVIYLLHGGAGGNSAQWTTGGGAAEEITANTEVITVMPDGGKVGWFTNWVDQHPAQRWADFYIDEVIPWVDANFRTVAAKSGRAIAGLSMGGYGAVRLAQDHPELFASVASFSGAVDLGDPGTRAVITEQSTQSFLDPFGAFGNPFWPADTVWNQEDPMKRVEQLRGMQILLYAGAGTSDADVIERTMGQSADRFSKTLDAHGIAHAWWMYGRPGPAVPYGCDGGHDFTCWNFAFHDALPKIASVLAVPPPPPAPPVVPGANVVTNAGFESGQADWSCLGGCGVDAGAGLARSGANNGWVRATGGWNDLHQTLAVAPNHTYTVTAWIRTSGNATAGYFGLRTITGSVVGETQFGPLASGYQQVTATVATGPNTQLVIYAGLWANGDTWLQLDDVAAVAQ